jgi:hypothetical protein
MFAVQSLTTADTVELRSPTGSVSSASSVFEYNPINRRYPAEYPPQIHTLPVIGTDYGRLLAAAAASEYRYGVSNTGARLPNAYFWVVTRK